MLNITSGRVTRPQKLVLYGVEGIGKTSLAAQTPDPETIDISRSVLFPPASTTIFIVFQNRAPLSRVRFCTVRRKGWGPQARMRPFWAAYSAMRSWMV